MIKPVILYSVSAAISKGSIFLYLPILTSSLSISEFGEYMIIQVTVQLLIPIISLNGSAAISRESALFPEIGWKLLKASFLLGLFELAVVLCALFWVHGDRAYLWIVYAVLVAIIESFCNSLLAWFQAREEAVSSVIFSIIKSLSLLGLFAFGSKMNWTLSDFVLFQAQLSFSLVIVTLAVVIFGLDSSIRNSNKRFSPISILLYAIPLIPHSLGLYVISSADRFIIKSVLGNEMLGKYSIAYTLGTALLLVNNGIVAALPPLIFKDYDKWISVAIRKRILIYISIVEALFFCIICLSLEIDKRYFGYIKYYGSEMPFIIALVSSGVYLLCFNYLYASFLLFHKKSLSLTRQTIIVAIVSIALTYLSVKHFGIIGAGFATLASYVLYATLVFSAASSVEPLLLRTKMTDLRIACIGITCMLLVGGSQALFWSGK